MANDNKFFQGCISNSWRACYELECLDKDKCPQFKKYHDEEMKFFEGKAKKND